MTLETQMIGFTNSLVGVLFGLAVAWTPAAKADAPVDEALARELASFEETAASELGSRLRRLSRSGKISDALVRRAIELNGTAHANVIDALRSLSTDESVELINELLLDPDPLSFDQRGSLAWHLAEQTERNQSAELFSKLRSGSSSKNRGLDGVDLDIQTARSFVRSKPHETTRLVIGWHEELQRLVVDPVGGGQQRLEATVAVHQLLAALNTHQSLAALHEYWRDYAFREPSWMTNPIIEAFRDAGYRPAFESLRNLAADGDTEFWTRMLAFEALSAMADTSDVAGLIQLGSELSIEGRDDQPGSSEVASLVSDLKARKERGQ